MIVPVILSAAKDLVPPTGFQILRFAQNDLLTVSPPDERSNWNAASRMIEPWPRPRDH